MGLKLQGYCKKCWACRCLVWTYTDELSVWGLHSEILGNNQTTGKVTIKCGRPHMWLFNSEAGMRHHFCGVILLIYFPRNTNWIYSQIVWGHNPCTEKSRLLIWPMTFDTSSLFSVFSTLNYKMNQKITVQFLQVHVESWRKAGLFIKSLCRLGAKKFWRLGVSANTGVVQRLWKCSFTWISISYCSWDNIKWQRSSPNTKKQDQRVYIVWITAGKTCFVVKEMRHTISFFSTV